MAALHATYDSHARVCANFIGTEKTSVLLAGRVDRSAVDTLMHLKRARAGLVHAADRGRRM